MLLFLGNHKKTQATTDRLRDAVYVTPMVEVTDISVEQNVLDSGSSELIHFGGEDW